jgi:hypothetical protein
MSLTNKLLSGIESNQTRADAQVVLGNTPIWQEFRLPDDIERGTSDNEILIPPLTGFSFLANVAAGTRPAVVVDWTLERFLSASGWSVIAEGSTVAASAEGSKVWFDVYFDDLITVDPTMLSDVLRFKIVGRTGGGHVNRVVGYSGGFVEGSEERFEATLVKDVPYLYTAVDGTKLVYVWSSEDSKVYESVQQNLAGVWYANLPGSTHIDAYRADNGSSAIAGTLAWRLLTASGDEGRDFLGNSYRHVIFQHSIGSVSTLDGDQADRYWFSKPNPSRFAVERQYFDITDALGAPTVVDSVLVDPITPNVYFNVYYSNDGEEVVTPQEWDNKLWTRVPKTFQAKRRDTHPFPEPIRARFMKIEYSHLQPRAYQPGPFQQPIRYQKHPKWVLDYFLARLNDQRVAEDEFVARRVSVNYDALDLAYNYYLDDLRKEPALPAQFTGTGFNDLNAFLTSRTDMSDAIDAATLDRINLALNPYREGLALQIKQDDTLLNRFVATTIGSTGREGVPAQTFSFDPSVSSLNRDAVIFEQSHPVMFFYIPSRHRYREVQASFSHDRAYFVGIREVAWLRERYAAATDTAMYVEVGGDNINLARSDFVHDNTSLIISDA